MQVVTFFRRPPRTEPAAFPVPPTISPVSPFRARSGLVVAAWLALLAVAPAAAAGRDAATAVADDVAALERGERVEAFGAAIRGSDVLAEFYRRRSFRPAWADSAAIGEAVAALEQSTTHGLDPADYRLPAIRAARVGDADSAARVDLLVTSSLLELALDLRYGRVPASAFPRDSLRSRPLTGPDPVADLEQAVDTGRLGEWLASLEPQTPFYDRLRQALAEYRRLADAGGWPLVETGPSLKPGDRDPRLAVLRERLAVTGDLPKTGAAAATELYDDATVEGVKAFQARHGLDPDGVLGKQTVAAMRVTAPARVDQIRATLERARWFLRDLPERYVMVNAAGFRVLLIEDGQVKWRARAIVGRPLTSTPMFRAEMRSVLLNPTWTVPTSIVRGEFLPEIRKDPHYLARKHISVVDGQYVQAAGKDNALGRIKLNLPNPHSVYLHDTPSRSLFSSTTRAFSHGCVRVENPVQLAALALDDPQWSLEALEAEIDKGKTRSIALKKPLTVFVLYWSATAAREGRVEFFPDLYGRDEEVLRGLAAAH